MTSTNNKTDFDDQKPPPTRMPPASEAATGQKFPNDPTAKCCPNVVAFVWPEDDEKRRYGYDLLTNKVNTKNEPALKNVQPFWFWKKENSFPPLGKLSPSSNEWNWEKHDNIRMTRDGSLWVSVPTNDHTFIEFQIEGNNWSPFSGCQKNIRFFTDDEDIAEVVEGSIDYESEISKTGTLKVKGLRPGETTLFAECSGYLLGWCQIYCADMFEYTVSIASYTYAQKPTVDDHYKRRLAHPEKRAMTPEAQAELIEKREALPKIRAANYDIEEIRAELNRIFKPSLIKITVIDQGVIDLPDTQVVRDALFGANVGSVFDRAGNMNTEVDYTVTFSESLEVLTNASGRYFYSDKEIIFLVAPKQRTLDGRSMGLPSHRAFMFVDDKSQDYTVTLAHELGHTMGLMHPMDDPDNIQFPKHLNDQASPNKGDPNYNVDPDDPRNLMSYSEYGTELHYLQWKVRR